MRYRIIILVTMKTIEVDVEIAASPARVWEILTDFDHYHEWNPSMPRLQGSPTVDALVKVQFKTISKTINASAQILVVELERELRWRGPVSGLFRFLLWGEHYWRLVPLGSEGTKLFQGERFCGPLVPLFSRLLNLNGDVLPAYRAFNTALKQRAEQHPA